MAKYGGCREKAEVVWEGKLTMILKKNQLSFPGCQSAILNLKPNVLPEPIDPVNRGSGRRADRRTIS